MANERIFLLHAPSGYYVPLGKRMAWGWYNVPKDAAERIQRLYDLIDSQEAQGDQDYIVVAFEGDPRLRFNVVVPPVPEHNPSEP